MKTERFEMIAKTFQGLEDVLAEEIIALGGDDVEIGRRMVAFTGDLKTLYKANLNCRTALRILKPILKFKAKDTDEVYEIIKKMNWDKYLSLDKTFSIDSNVFADDFRNSKFVTYRAKDAIADYFLEKYDKRPSVRVNNADIALNLHIASNHICSLSLDSSGESLHKRGYRIEQTEAPLNEVLAAGMILKSGWRGEKNFIDPMCGSGTLLIEAGMIALNMAPGIHRQEFAFQKWADYNDELFQEIYHDDSDEKPFDFKIYGSDISPKAIEIAENNVKSAGLSKYITLKVMPFQRYEKAPENGIMITNPPYGERITTKDLLGLYEMIGERLKHVFKGYEAWILSYREECFEKIGLKPSVKIPLMNGALDCEYRKYEIFSGKYKEFKEGGGNIKNRGSEPLAKPQQTQEAEDNAETVDFASDSAPERKYFDRDKSKESGASRGYNKESRFDRKENNDHASDYVKTERGEYNHEKHRERMNKDRGFGERKSFGEKISYDKSDRGEFRPARQRINGETPNRERTFSDRPKREGSFGDRPKREGSFSDRPKRTGSFSDRPKREGSFSDRPKRTGSFSDRPKREGSFSDRPKREGSFSDRPKREGSFSDRPKREGSFSDRPKREGSFSDRPKREGSFSDRPKREGSFSDRPKREGSFSDRPKREGSFSDRPKREGSFSDRPKREGSFSDRPKREGSGSQSKFAKESGFERKPRSFERDSSRSGSSNKPGFGSSRSFNTKGSSEKRGFNAERKSFSKDRQNGSSFDWDKTRNDD